MQVEANAAHSMIVHSPTDSQSLGASVAVARCENTRATPEAIQRNDAQCCSQGCASVDEAACGGVRVRNEQHAFLDA